MRQKEPLFRLASTKGIFSPERGISGQKEGLIVFLIQLFEPVVIFKKADR